MEWLAQEWRQQERNKQLLEERQQTNFDETAAATSDKELADLPDYVITDIDRMMDGACVL